MYQDWEASLIDIFDIISLTSSYYFKILIFMLTLTYLLQSHCISF